MFLARFALCLIYFRCLSVLACKFMQSNYLINLRYFCGRHGKEIMSLCFLLEIQNDVSKIVLLNFYLISLFPFFVLNICTLVFKKEMKWVIIHVHIIVINNTHVIIVNTITSLAQQIILLLLATVGRHVPARTPLFESSYPRHTLYLISCPRASAFQRQTGKFQLNMALEITV